jgi:hypothetical protein
VAPGRKKQEVDSWAPVVHTLAILLLGRLRSGGCGLRLAYNTYKSSQDAISTDS